MIKVVITTLRPLENRGVEALARSIVEGLIDNFNDIEITVLTNEPELARRAMPQDCVRFVADDAFGPPNGVAPWKLAFPRLRRQVRRDLLGRRRPVEEAFRDADLVLVSGGDVFSSTYGTMDRYLWQLEYPIALGKPVLFFAQSIGIFETEAEERSFTSRARRCHFTVREAISERYLIDRLGIEAARITRTADPAFLLAPAGPAVLERYGLAGRRYAAAVVSRGISTFRNLSHDDHVQAWLAAIGTLLDRVDKVVLVPHVQPVDTPDENDLFLAQELQEKLHHDQRVVVMQDADLGAHDFKAVLAGAEFAVAERTHGAIGAMSAGVPVLSIGYSIKSEGILRELVADEALLKLSLVPAEMFTPQHAAGIVARAWDARERFAQELAQSLPEAKRRARLNYEIARKLALRH